jgi:hypothetical protein
MNRLRINTENNSIYNSLKKKNQMPRNKLNNGCQWSLKGKVQTTEEGNQRRLQKVKRSPMLMGLQNQHSKNSYTTRSNLHVQCNSHQNPNDIHHRDWKIYPEVHLETKKSVNSQGNTEQKSNAGGHNTWLQIILQSQSNKNSMVPGTKTDMKTPGTK